MCIFPMIVLSHIENTGATLALAGVALGSLFHYVTKGPNEVSEEIEDEIEREDNEEAK